MKMLTRAMVAENPKMKETLMKRVDSIDDLPSRCKLHASIMEIDFIYQLVEKEEQELLNRKNFGRRSLVLARETLGSCQLAFGMRLTKELKSLLEIPLNGKEPSESNEYLPSIEELDKRIAKLTWLRDNYDAVKAGIKAFSSSSLATLETAALVGQLQYCSGIESPVEPAGTELSEMQVYALSLTTRDFLRAYASARRPASITRLIDVLSDHVDMRNRDRERQGRKKLDKFEYIWEVCEQTAMSLMRRGQFKDTSYRTLEEALRKQNLRLGMKDEIAKIKDRLPQQVPKPPE